jgi:hypothetical protein
MNPHIHPNEKTIMSGWTVPVMQLDTVWLMWRPAEAGHGPGTRPRGAPEGQMPTVARRVVPAPETVMPVSLADR